MAEIPTVESLGARPTPNAVPGIRSLRGGEQVGAAMQRFAGQVGNMGQAIIEKEATAAAKERDTYVGDELRKAMYDPETGFMNTQGRASVDRQGEIESRIDQIEEEATKGLTGLAARKAEASIRGRVERARQGVLTHTSAQRDTWLNGASEARIQSAAQDAIFNPAETQNAINTIEGEVLDLARRQGWDPEKTELEMDQRVSALYATQIKGLATTNPMKALEYLDENAEDILPSVQQDLRAALEPEARRYRGRQAGAAALQTDTAGPRGSYYAAIRTAESGGNDQARNPNSSATGRYQFIESTWNELMRKHPDLGLTPDGRLDPAQQEKAIRAFTDDNAKILAGAGIAETNANLYAAHFLGAGGAVQVLSSPDGAPMADVVSPGVMRANPHLRGMTVADFKAWTRRKAGTGAPAQGEPDAGMSGMRSLLEIEDPDERDAAIREYNLLAGVQENEARARRDQAMGAAWQLVDQGGDINSLSFEDKQAIGFENVVKLQAYQNNEVNTDPAFKTALWEMYGSDPNAFMAQDPMDWLGNLSRRDYDDFVELRAKMRRGETDDVMKPRAVSTMMTMADAALRGAGITSTKQGERYNAFQGELTDWARANPELANDDQALQRQINKMLVPVVLDTSWLPFSASKGQAFEIDLDGDPLDPTDDITLDEMMGASIKLGDRKVTDGMKQAVVNAYRRNLSRDPTPQEMLDALLEAGLD